MNKMEENFGDVESKNGPPHPLIDITNLRCSENETGSENEAEYLRIGEEILKSFGEAGFVYLKNFGLSHQAVENLSRGFDEFFDLPQDIKRNYSRNLENFHGYATNEEEKVQQFGSFNVTQRESFDIQNLEYIMPEDEVPKLRNLASICLDALYKKSKSVFLAIDQGLGTPNRSLFEGHNDMKGTENFSEIRCLRYQPVPLDAPAETIRMEEHEDIGTLTYHLFDDAGGLQVLSPQGKWIEAEIPPGYLLLFPGRILQAWTWGRIKATRHRVSLPNQDTKHGHRHSIIYFAHPNHDTKIPQYDVINKLWSSMTAQDFAFQEGKLIYEALNKGENEQ